MSRLNVKYMCEVMYMDVNKRLGELLAQRGWTRYRLSKESGVPETTLTNIFYRGTVPTIATLEQICDTLGVTLSQFFADGDVVEMTEDLEEFYSAWLALSPDKRKNVLETMKLMK